MGLSDDIPGSALENDDTDTSSGSVVDEIAEQFKREFAAAYESTDYDLENADEWGEISYHTIERFAPSNGIIVDGRTEFAGFRFEPDQFTEASSEVWCGMNGVTIETHGEVDEDTDAGSCIRFTPQEAREVAVSLWQGAEVLEAWREGSDE